MPGKERKLSRISKELIMNPISNTIYMEDILFVCHVQGNVMSTEKLFLFISILIT